MRPQKQPHCKIISSAKSSISTLREMGQHEEKERIFGDQNRKENHGYQVGQDYWVIKEDHAEDICDSRSIESSQENSLNSMSSSSSSDVVEDASSSSSSSSSSNGPLYELSELMIHLPMRRGLSKYYQGKSQSFTSLASVKSLEDLAKKVAPYRRKNIKPCKSYGGGLDARPKSYTTTPKAVISKKKASRRSSFLYSITERGNLLG